MDGLREALEPRLAAAGVTRREREVFWEVAGRLRNREIADRLHLSERTVESHVAALLRKLEATRRDDLVRLAADTAATAHGLPAVSSSFVGRRQERDRLVQLVVDHRVVTLTGVAGAGKTRLALLVAASTPGLPPPVLVDLSTLPVGAEVDGVLATALGATEGEGSAAGALRAAVVDRPRWLVVDNAEHVLGHLRPRLADLLATTSSLRLLITSRSPVGLPGEVLQEVHPLELPPDSDDPTEVLSSDAARLFAERGAQALPGFRVTSANARAVAAICRRLDGLPLAIELAAARVRTFAPAELAALLDDRFTVLTTASSRPGDRHATLGTALEWSLGLLDDLERRLFARLAVFPGEFSYDAAVAVAATPPLGEETFLSTFSRLFDRSLVTAMRYDDGTRYRLLESVRAFAHRLLDDREAAELGRRHATHHLRQAVVTAGRARGHDQQAALRQFDRHWSDVQTAVTWALAHGEDALVWDLLEGVGTAWESVGIRAGLLDWLEELLGRGAPPGRDLLGAHAAAACLLVYRDPRRAARFARAWEAAAADDASTRGVRSLVLGWALLYGDGAAAAPHLERARVVFQDAMDTWHEALALQGLGLATADLGASVTFLTRSAALFELVGDEVKQANALVNLAARRIAAWPDPLQASAAEAELAVARELAARTGSVHERRHVQLHTAWLEQLQGRHDRAATALQEALPVFRELGDRRCVARCLLGLARAALASGDSRAARARLDECLAEAVAVGSDALTAEARQLLVETTRSQPADGARHQVPRASGEAPTPATVNRDARRPRSDG